MIKLLLLFSIALQSGNAFSFNGHHIPLTGEDQGVNIPKVGSSLFDKIFSKVDQENNSVYDIPYPLNKLMIRLSGRVRKNDVLHSMLPFSRSLQRPSGTRYDPLLNPRLVFSVKQSQTSIERSKIFMGFVKETNQIEVISYNDEAGRFEYQLVKDYGNNPKVFYVNRGKCLSCHQGQAPIFSVPGWNDTNTGVLGGLIGAKLGVEKPTSLNGKIEIANKLFGDIPSLDAVGNFDALVRESNEISLNERVWAIGCGKSNACRLGLLLSTLAAGSEESTKYFSISKQEIKKSSLPSQNMYSSFLASTDIGATKIIKQYTNIGNGTPYENTSNSPEAILEIIGNIYKLSERENPGTRRTMSFNNDSLFPRSLKSFNFTDLSLLSKEVPGDISKVLETLYFENNEIFHQSSINKPLIMKTILKKVKSAKASIYEDFLNKRTPKKELFTGRTIPVFKKRELNIFARYCHQCHASGLPFPPQFLIGDEQEVIKKIGLLKSKIKFKLTNRLMPPDQSERIQLETSGDLQILLDYIEEFKTF